MSEQEAIKKAARYMFENRTLELDSSPDEEDEWDNLPWQEEWIEGAEIALEGFRRAGLIPMPDAALSAVPPRTMTAEQVEEEAERLFYRNDPADYDFDPYEGWSSFKAGYVAGLRKAGIEVQS